jgi:hypothetical protein
MPNDRDFIMIGDRVRTFTTFKGKGRKYEAEAIVRDVMHYRNGTFLYAIVTFPNAKDPRVQHIRHDVDLLDIN